uniref:Peptidase n=2 Tax=viral metagenome TaxID=1070528 RepID=A0A6M3Y040_9ZZZZ
MENNMYIPKYFRLYELLPKDYYNENLINWYIFDNRLLFTLDKIREKFGLIVINDWFPGGTNQYRGWRPFDCKVGAKLSQHKFGRACDLIPIRCTPKEIRDDIMKNPLIEDYKYITCIENFDNMSWVHIDCRNHNKEKNGLFIVKP